MLAINELVLRVPGIGEEEGRLLAAEVGERLAQAMPPARLPSNIDEIRVSMPGNIRGGRSALADNIVNQIITQLHHR